MCDKWKYDFTLCSASLFTSGLDALFDVRKEMNKVSAKWRSIGIALRLDPNILDGIQTKNSGDPQACLSSVVTEWLKRNYNVKRFGEPTWEWLVDAVGDPAGGAHMALAKDIASRHKLKGTSGGYTYKEVRIGGWARDAAVPPPSQLLGRPSPPLLTFTALIYTGTSVVCTATGCK